MQKLSKIKIGPILVISSVLALWTFLITQHVQAHPRNTNLPTPSCSSLPGDNFFGTAETLGLASNAPSSGDLDTKRGGGTSGTGNISYHYAKITIPTLAAGELRVFDATAAGSALSNAVLCQGSSQVARSITSYTAHNTAHAAAAAAGGATTNHAASASAAAQKAADALLASQTIEYTDVDNNTQTVTSSPVLPDNPTQAQRTNHQRAVSALRSALSTARSALSTARSALNTARSNLATAARALYAASTAPGDTAETNGDTAAAAEQAALNAYNDPTNQLPLSSLEDYAELEAVRIALGTGTAVGGALTTASGVLTTASGHLTAAANAMHTGFQIRASAMPGDEEYIVVVAPENTGTPPRASTAAMDLNVAFHGAIATTSSEKRQRVLSAGVTDTINITITAPGLLTLETTGSTDTVGTLDEDPTGTPVEIAHAEAGGSGGNFKIVAPVTTAAHSLEVDGQDTRESGAYTLDMDFKVAMQTGASGTNITVPAAPTWANTTGVPADDTTVQIQRSAADGNVADEDYFLFTPDNSGLLTVNANDDNTAAPDANTRGTLFGAMGQGPAEGRRTGQIATDANSGPGGTHFKFAVPVEGGRDYLVKVEGTDGVYTLEFALVQTRATDTAAAAIPAPITLPYPSIDVTLSAGGKDWYLFNIEESGNLYVHTTGATDVVGFLSGPDGSLVGEDDNSGAGTNFRIAVNVAPGLYILEVEGQTAQTTGAYTLVSSFVAGPGPEPPTEPTTPTTPTTPEPVTDATGNLGNPPHNSTRSGIGIISGWVCEAGNVAITISPVGEGTSPEQTFNIGYGADRPDTVGQCAHRSPDTGFGMAFNFNRLLEGQYRITARADEQQIGSSHLFTVIHLVPDDTFPRDLEGEVDVPNFPTTGQTTTLEWETESQGFVITDIQ